MIKPPSLLSVVEGYSEVKGVPIVLRRLLAELERFDLVIERPIRISRTKILRGGEVEQAVSQGIRDRSEEHNVKAVLVLVDGDDPPYDVLSRKILEDYHRATQLPVAAVVAIREFEAWFLGAKESLRGVRGIKPDAKSPDNPESIRGAKERLTRNMERNRSYVEVVDQPAFAAVFDLEAARVNCPSFQFLCNELRRLIAEIAVA